MMSKVLVIFFAVTVTFCLAQLAYEGDELNQNKKPTKHGRQPIISDKCAEGEFLYPGDNEKDWTCDCRPAYVYEPTTMKCYPVYEQGPCKNREILILPMKKSIPKCVTNSCPGKKVYHNGKCVTLNTNEGCPKQFKVQVNPTSLELGCSILIPSRFGSDEEENDVPKLNYSDFPIDNKGSTCLLGGKRSQDNKCLEQ